jgi:hypothetical protein
MVGVAIDSTLRIMGWAEFGTAPGSIREGVDCRIIERATQEEALRTFALFFFKKVQFIGVLDPLRQ